MSFIPRTSVLAVSLSLAAVAAAQDAPFEAPFEEIIVTSSRIATPLRQVGTSVSVINEEEIRARGASSLIDILRSMPSVAVSNSGGVGKTSTLRIRGEEGFRTVTLIDGLKLSDPSLTQVQPQLEHTLSSGIERVEILRGPQGFSYGADAGGVVNISTRSGASGLHGQLDALSGSDQTRQVSASVAGGNERADFYLSAADHSSEGFNILDADSVLRDRDGYENTTLHARAGIDLTDQLRLNFVHRDVSAESAFDNCFDPVTFNSVHDCDSAYDQQATRLSALLETSSGLSQQLAWSRTQTDRQDHTLGQPAFFSEGKLERFEYLGSLTSLPGMDIVFGIDSEEEDNNGDTRRQTGYYAEYLSDFSSAWFFSAGLRQDRNDDFGGHSSYRVTAARLFDLAGGTLKLRANHGTGFRAPSLYEVGYNQGAWAMPPASQTQLSEETSTGSEVAAEYQGNTGLALGIVYFQQEIEDAIYFDLATFSGYLQDVGTSESEGVELTASIPLTARLTATGNYTWNDTRRPDGQQRQRRPRDLANLGLRYQHNDRLQLSAFWRHTANAIDQVNEQVFGLDNYQVFDLSMSYHINDSVSLSARLENVNDDRFEEVVGYRNAGRSAYLGLRIAL